MSAEKEPTYFVDCPHCASHDIRPLFTGRAFCANCGFSLESDMFLHKVQEAPSK